MSEDTIFREVDEELRRDRLRTGWRRFGPLLIGAAVVVVLLVAANEGWAWWQNSNAARSSDQFYAALDLEDGGDVAGAQKALATVVTQGSGQYPVLAQFKQAGLLAKEGKKDDALAAYDALATSQGNPRLRGLALLLGANLLVDKGDVPGVKSRILGLIAPDDPLRNSARETLGLAQYKAGDLNGARDSFEAVVADPNSPDEARGRMQLFVSQLVAQGATPPATEAEAGTPADAAAAAVQAIGAAASGGTVPTPAANDNGATAPAAATPAPADDTTPAGVESSQPSTPDAALDMAVPAGPADATAPDATQPTLSTGLPTSDEAAPAMAPAVDGTAAPTPAPADGAAPATTGAAAPATDSAPAPATGTTGQ